LDQVEKIAVIAQRPPQRTSVGSSGRQVDDEGALRMLLLAFALALPLATMAYLKIQQTRLSYQMSDLRGQITQEEERRRTLMLERSFYQRSEAVKAFADQTGMQPRKLAP
jgi:uncharacterized protein HemX